MLKNLTLIYWKGEKYYLGKILEHPEIMNRERPWKSLWKISKMPII